MRCLKMIAGRIGRSPARAGVSLALLFAACVQAQSAPRFGAIEMHLVLERPRPGVPQVMINDAEGGGLAVAAIPLLVTEDFITAGSVSRTEGRAGFLVYLTPRGQDKLTRLSTENVGRSIAVVISGRALMVVRVLDPITVNQFLVTIEGSEAEAAEYAANINAAIAASPVVQQ